MGHQDENLYEQAAFRAVELANRMADDDQEADLWDIADGLLAGAIQYWLYARQPCPDPACEECEAMRTAELRLADLLKITEHFARESDYYHSPNDSNVGRA